MLALDKVTRADFLPCLQEEFLLRTGEAELHLRLVNVVAVGGGCPGGREAFALRFLGEPALRLRQGVHRLENATVGAMEIFLVQTGADAQGSYFEAIFS
jgi:hypothetical protein